MAKLYHLTPHRKNLGKALGRKSYKSIANNCWNNDLARPYLYARICRDLVKEVKTLCSNSVNSSILNKSEPTEMLQSFTWMDLESEIHQHAPLLYLILMAITKTKQPRPNRSAVLCVCASIILKISSFQNECNSKTNLLYSIVVIVQNM